MPLCFLFGFRDVAEPWRTKEDIEGDAAEVTGSADIEHLSRFAPFRRARNALKARSTHSPKTTSSRSRNTQPSPAFPDYRSAQMTPGTIPAPVPAPTPAYNADSQQPLPNLRPEYSNYMPAQTLPMNQMSQVSQVNQMGQGFFPAPDSGVSQMAEMMPDIMVPQPSMDDYIRTAGDMAGYLTWDVMEVPAWLNYGNLFPPAG